jgi:DNA mismatch repair protein MutH
MIWHGDSTITVGRGKGYTVPVRPAAPAPSRRPPPRDLAELVLRAQALEGRTLGELARALGSPLPPDPRRAKGIAGQLVERALGADGGSAAAPDFARLGVELKTIPVDGALRPRESTFVATIAPLAIAGESWPTCRVRRKLSHVLWVPITAWASCAGDRVFGAPRLWRPSPAEERVLCEDWEELAGLVAIGRIDEITGHRGRFLQIRPKAAHGRVRSFAPGPDEVTRPALPRGFYLRAVFTACILRGEEGTAS